MGLLDIFSSRKALTFTQAEFFNNGLLLPNRNTKNFIEDGFLQNADVYAIVSLAARKFGSVPILLYQVKDEKALRQYKASVSDGGISVKEANALRKKALEEVDSEHPINKLLLRPNPQQGQDLFFENLFGFKMLTGMAVMWANRPDGGKPLELDILPTQNIKLESDGTIYGVGKVSLGNTPLNVEDVLIWKYWNPNVTQGGDHLYGLSPLHAAALTVQRSTDSAKAGLKMIQNGGARGMLVREGQEEITFEQAIELKNKIDTEVNGLENKGRTTVSNLSLRWIDMGMSAIDLNIIETAQYSKEQLCNVFGVPIELFSSKDATYNNRREAVKFFLTNKIIPEWSGLRDELNRWLLPMFEKNTNKFFIDIDTTVIPELQDDMEKMVNTLKSADWLTPNEKRVAMNYGEVDNENMNQVYLPAGLRSVDEISMMNISELAKTIDGISSTAV